MWHQQLFAPLQDMISKTASCSIDAIAKRDDYCLTCCILWLWNWRNKTDLYKFKDSKNLFVLVHCAYNINKMKSEICLISFWKIQICDNQEADYSAIFLNSQYPPCLHTSKNESNLKPYTGATPITKTLITISSIHYDAKPQHCWTFHCQCSTIKRSNFLVIMRW
jgi:hypothetical protein